MEARRPETCDACGFDARRWTVPDAVSLLDALGWWWRHATEGIAADELNARPAPGVWSALEYGEHSALVTAVIRVGLEAILAHDGVTLPAPPPAPDAGDEPARRLDREDVVAGIEREAGALADLARGAPDAAWGQVGHVGGERLEAAPLLLHAVHDATHHQHDVGRGLAAIGAGTPAGHGRVVQVSVSDGGVPKRSVPSARVEREGLVGDRQADRRHHGRPFQALCLWSADALAELADVGVGLAPGSVGENLTLTGVAWTDLRPGARLRVGSALAELSFPATPCHKQARWFADRDVSRLDHGQHPGWARWYAWVREPGAVAAGDPVVVQPESGIPAVPSAMRTASPDAS